MTYCCAVDCKSNSFTKDRKKGLRFFGLPKGKHKETLRKKWIHNIKRQNLPKDPYVCELHFEKSCFKRDLEVCLNLCLKMFNY